MARYDRGDGGGWEEPPPPEGPPPGGYRGDGPFVPEEAYRQHPEYDQPPREGRTHGFDADEVPDDEEIRRAVWRYVQDDPWLEARRLHVEVEDGVVTLTGEVDDFLEARYAGDDAWEAAGVRGVVNHLTVRADLRSAPHGDVVPQTGGDPPAPDAGAGAMTRCRVRRREALPADPRRGRPACRGAADRRRVRHRPAVRQPRPLPPHRQPRRSRHHHRVAAGARVALLVSPIG